MKFNEKLQELRKEHQLSQEQLAEKLLVSRQAISKWESGKSMPDIANLVKLSEIFQMSLDDLIKDSSQEWPHQKKSSEDMETMSAAQLKITTAGAAIGLAIGLLLGRWWLIFVGVLVFYGISIILSTLGLIDHPND